MPATTTHPLDALNTEDRAAIDSAINLCLDGITGWRHAISLAIRITDYEVHEGRLTTQQRDAIVEYTRSF